MTKPIPDLFRFYYHAPLDPKMVNQARRAAARRGWRVEKSRTRYQHMNNQGGLMLLNENNIAIDGWDYDLMPEDVLQICG
jgi:hypothetical protein